MPRDVHPVGLDRERHLQVRSSIANRHQLSAGCPRQAGAEPAQDPERPLGEGQLGKLLVHEVEARDRRSAHLQPTVEPRVSCVRSADAPSSSRLTPFSAAEWQGRVVTRLVVIMLVLGTLIGVLMPTGKQAPAPANSEEPVIWVNEPAPPAAGSGNPDPEAQVLSAGSIRLERQADGHFYADVQVNGATVNFMVDTGASGIALTIDDAQRAGLQFSRSSFEVVGEGASGPVKGQLVSLDRVRLGSKTLQNTEAVIIDGGSQSLLGQSFLQQFGEVRIKDDTMVLR